ncbi:MAG: methyltransferase domain-containing protein [Pseudomonadota bacterium]
MSAAQATTKIDRWLKDEEEDQRMTDDHLPLWDRMIELMDEPQLTGAKILDYGCNTGGLLQRLYHTKPYASGFGVDLAEDQIKAAREQRTDGPYKFAGVGALDGQVAEYDFAFSHEVIYLLPSIEEHAQLIRRVLKPGGVYYACTGCHTANPQWPQWRDIIAEYSNVKPGDYSPEDYGFTFERAGFKVGVQPFGTGRFLPLEKREELFPTVASIVDYYRNHKLLFRFQRDHGPVEAA